MSLCGETRKNDEPMLKSRLAWGFTEANTDFNLAWWESLVVVLKQDIDWESPFLCQIIIIQAHTCI